MKKPLLQVYQSKRFFLDLFGEESPERGSEAAVLQ